MQARVQLNKVRNNSEIFNDSILFLKQNWRPLLKAYWNICGFCLVASIVFAVYNTAESFELIKSGQSVFTWSYFVRMLFGLVTYTLVALTTFSFIAIYHENGQKAPETAEIWQYVKYYFFRILGSNILLTAITLIAFLLLIIPGIYFIPFYSLIIAIMVLENTSLNYAFNHSFKLVKENWWRTFGALMSSALIALAFYFILFIPALMIISIISLLTGKELLVLYNYAVQIIAPIAMITYIFYFILTALVYYSLEEEQGAGSLLARIEVLGRKAEADDSGLLKEEY